VRLAVPEAEAWVFADHAAFSEHFRIHRDRVRRTADAPEYLPDPKACLLQLIRSGGITKSIKEGILPFHGNLTAGIGPLYRGLS
jgi:hypothetical protein